MHFHVPDRSVIGALTAPGDHMLHLIPVPLEDRFDAAIGKVADPTRAADGPGPPPGFLAEEHALNLARDEHVGPNHGPARITKAWSLGPRKK